MAWIWSRNSRQIPVIMLTAKGEEEHKLAGFAGGVEDYVTKPFSPKELIARIRALLKRVEMHDGGDAPIRLCFGPLMLEPEAFRVSVAGEAVALGPTEYRLLAFFMHHPNKVYSRGQLLDKVWGQNVYIEERTVDVHIRRLRKALTPYGVQDTVQTVRGAGYRFSP
jgi:two-component system phosphate regulon response regulator PhoB